MRNSNPQISLQATTLKQLECATTVTQLGERFKSKFLLI